MAAFRSAYRECLKQLSGFHSFDSLDGDFAPAYKGILAAEGGYANNAGDKGGETFAGIARVYNPNWPGWAIIDSVKGNYDLTSAAGRKALNAALFANADLMNAHYDYSKKNYWDVLQGDNITDQDTANIIFDFFFNSGNNAIKTLKAVIDVTKGNTPAVSAVIDATMLQDINSLPKSKLYPNIYAGRAKYFAAIVSANPSQQKFYDGWMKRLSNFKLDFPEAEAAAAGAGAGIVTTLLIMAAAYWGYKKYA